MMFVQEAVMRTDDTSLFGHWALGVPNKTLAVDLSSGDFTVPDLYRQIMVSVPGDVAVVQHDGTGGLLPALQPGVPVTFSAKEIKDAAGGTTATGIVLLA
jgi:hypothetical protein